MGLLRSLKGLITGASDDQAAARQIYYDARAERRPLTNEELDQIKKLRDMREDKLERAREGEGWTGLG